MRLWTEYEGETIDGAFPLKQLLLPEGRSAFFCTANAQGDPALLRLIECHFDEEEILARWRTVEALNHPHFLRLERYGQIELDGSPAVYAIFEKSDAKLSEVLAQGHLSVKDTADLAGSLVAALEMLHNHGFVHEHVVPESIFAVGDVVKLRSDCIREAREGQEGRDAKQRDIQALAVVLLQALTQRTSLDGLPASALPPPFDGIVRNGTRGTWGLAEIRAALGTRVATPAKPGAAKPAALPPREAVQKPADLRATEIQSAAGQEKPGPRPVASPQPRPARPRPEFALPSAIHQEPWPKHWEETLSHSRLWKLRSPRSKWFGVAAMVAIVTLLALLATHEWRGHRQSATSPVAHVAATPAGKIARPKPAKAPHETFAPVSVPASHQDRAARTQWRVIAYTYNHVSEAQKKAATLARARPDLHPQVFTPSGHAPYLVAVGGVMNREQAVSLAHALRGRGLPRDTYAQNY